MPWIESHTEVGRHRKLLHVADDLGVSLPQVVGHMHLLWHAVLEQQEDGDLSTWSDAMISRQAQYEGDPATFVNVLIEHKLLDANRLVHDWLEYAGKYLTSKYRNSNPRKLQRISKVHKTVLRRSKPRPETVHHKGRLSGLSHLGSERGGGEEGGVQRGEDYFDAFWEAYPRKVGKVKAREAWQKLNPDEELTGRIIEAVNQQKRWPQWNRDGGQYIPHPTSWLNRQGWEDQQPEVAKQDDKLTEALRNAEGFLRRGGEIE